MKTGNQVEILEQDITGMLGERVTVCILQLKSPFFDECSPKLVAGHNLLVWDVSELQKRKKKILSILENVKRYRKDVNIIVLPEYAIHYDMIETLRSFADSKKTILISTYYDDRRFIDGEPNECFRRNVLSVILPNKTSIENITKIEKTSNEADFVSDSPDGKMRITKFSWSVNTTEKLFFQVFICGDFLEHFDKVDREKGGIVIVPMCSSEIEEFSAPSKLVVRPHRRSKTERCVLLCNSTTFAGRETKEGAVGRSQIFGPYRWSLPRLEDVEGGIIVTVKGTNIITKPSAVPSRFNIVLEDPVSFLLQQERGEWKILEKESLVKKRWVINPKVFSSLGLGTYFSFMRARSYYAFRSVFKYSSAKCFGIEGHDDVVVECLAEEEPDSRMLFYGGRSDVAACLEVPRYFHVERSVGYIKYKGFRIDSKLLSMDAVNEIKEHKEDIYKLAMGISDNEIDEGLVKKWIDMEIVLGEEVAPNVEDLRTNKQAEFLVGLFFPIRIDIEDPCKTFESKVVYRDLIEDPNIKDILYSAGGGGGPRGRAINLHYLLRVIGDVWSIRDLALDRIQKPLYAEGIECGTTIMPIADYLSNLEYEALLDSPIPSPSTRRMIREITNVMISRLEQDAFLIRRLPLSDMEKMIKIYHSRGAIANALRLEVRKIEDKIVKLFHGWILSKIKPDRKFDAIYDDFSDIYVTLARCAERVLFKNLSSKQKEIGSKKFLDEISSYAKKEIVIEKKSGLGVFLMATSIWNKKRRDNPILDENYSNRVKQLQHKRADKIRNYFSHGERELFMSIPDRLEEDIGSTIDALLSLIEFVVEFSY